jgi:hypothetical protein
MPDAAISTRHQACRDWEGTTGLDFQDPLRPAEAAQLASTWHDERFSSYWQNLSKQEHPVRV